ncbi:hypothetical protein VitviT2T_014145 [Vitis vinifera]|uniref:Uncharacterized protein n=1 Tax=Vitis vinifera TaxID=29760 RepID=A0ABY9CJI9_VITVI|nr:hypothetical protein VitviT2T_014145 [Vitis vinifera]
MRKILEEGACFLLWRESQLHAKRKVVWAAERSGSRGGCRDCWRSVSAGEGFFQRGGQLQERGELFGAGLGDVFRGEVFLRRLQVEFPEGGRLAEGEGRVFLAGFQGFFGEESFQESGGSWRLWGAEEIFGEL